jgi:quinol monooxygenase YgiN
MKKYHHMINAIYIFKTDKKTAKEQLELLNKVLERVKYVPGCHHSDIWFKKGIGEMMLFETWTSMTDLINHIHSPIYKWMLAAIDLSTGEPFIRFSECDNASGIEMIRKTITEKEENSIKSILQ